MLSQNTPICDPTKLGPLSPEPVVATGPSRVFTGEERFLSKRKLDERERMWAAVAPLLERVTDDDETVLYLLPGLHIPGIFDQLGFGIWWTLFFRSVLVLTDRRLIEVSTPDWKRAGTRICTYEWLQVKKIKLSMATLTVAPAQGRAQKWKLPVRGDRKLLKLLVPKLQELLPVDMHAPQPEPQWHCPECGAATAQHPTSCADCGSEFKKPGLAVALALAVPGAGLLYVGHPVLALFDLIGEVFAFFFVAAIFLTGSRSPEVFISGVMVGLFLLVLTKAESAHLATTLVKRTIPETDAGRWKKLAIAGAVASVVLMALPPVFSGAWAERLDRDLDLSGNAYGWTGGFDRETWVYGADDDQRSEWLRDDGPALFVFSMPSTERIGDIEAVLEQDGMKVEKKLFGGFECVRAVGETVDEEGNPLLWVRWFLFDREVADLHIVAASVWPGDLAAVEPQVEDAVRTAAWIPLDG